MGSSDRPVQSTSSAAVAGPSRPGSAKKRKRDKEQLTKTKADSVILPSEETGRTEKELDSGTRRRETSKEHRRKRKRAEPAIEDGHSPVDDMTIEPIFRTSTGKPVHNQNAGLVLTEYLQAFHQDPQTFVPNFDITLIPPPDLAERKWKHDPNNPSQPPPGSLYTCTVTMPPGVPIRTASTAGPGYRSRILAKQHASGAMVKKLVDAGQMTANLEPKPTGPAVKEKKIKAKDRKDMEWFEKQQKLNTTLASPQSSMPKTTTNARWKAFKESVRDQLPPVTVSKDGRKGYVDVDTMTSPNFWRSCPIFGPRVSVYPTLITFSITGDHAACRTLCLLTTLPLPETGDGLEINLSVPTESSRAPVIAKATLQARPRLKKLSPQQLQSAFTFTRRVIREHMNLPFEGSLADCRWLVLPMRSDTDADRQENVKRKHFDWDQVHATNTPLPVPFDFAALNDLDDKALSELMYTVRSEFSQRDCVIKARSDLKPDSPHPDFPEQTVAQHAVYRREDSPEPQVEYPDQPVFECTAANAGRHGGYPVELVQDREVRLIVPEFGARHTLSASVYRSTSILPTLLPRLDDFLIARQISQDLFASTINTPLALQAITSPMSTHDHSRSYERLEILGDTLLKLLATVDLYIRPPDPAVDLDKAHATRHIVLSNRVLQKCATSAGVPAYIRHVRHKAKDWHPSGWKVEGQTEAQELPSVIGGKVVADVAEALIGASYTSQGRSMDSAITATRTMRIPLQALTKWSDAKIFFQSLQESRSTSQAALDPLRSLLQASKVQVFGYVFTNPERGRIVLSRSRTAEQDRDCMRFKLLGDALLEYFVIEDMWDRYPDAGPQEMTVMKHSRMGDGTLSALCATLPLYDQLNITREEQSQYKKYRTTILEAKAEADGIIGQLGTAEKPDGRAVEPFQPDEVGQEWWADLEAYPLAGDVVDCVLGSILEDSAYDLDVTRNIYRDHLAPFFERYCLGPHRESLHPKSQVSQLFFGKRHCRHYEMRNDGLNKATSQTEASVVLHGQVVGRGSATAQVLALRRACADLMSKVRADPQWVDSICDCPSKPK